MLGAAKAVQPFLLPGAFALVLLGSLLAPFLGSKPKLEILAAVAPQGDDSVAITGRVLHEGRGFRGATVVAVANTRLGNEYSAEGKTQPPRRRRTISSASSWCCRAKSRQARDRGRRSSGRSRR